MLEHKILQCAWPNKHQRADLERYHWGFIQGLVWGAIPAAGSAIAFLGGSDAPPGLILSGVSIGLTLGLFVSFGSAKRSKFVEDHLDQPKGSTSDCHVLVESGLLFRR